MAVRQKSVKNAMEDDDFSTQAKHHPVRHSHTARKIRTLFSHPWKVLTKYLQAFENVVGSNVSLIDHLAFNMSRERLQQFMRKERSLDDILRTAFNYAGYWGYRNILPEQIPAEMKQLAEDIEKLSPSTILEIGTSNGGTLYIWARHIKSCRTIISLDLPRGSTNTKMEFFRLFDETKEFCFLRGNSHAKRTVDKLAKILGPTKVEFLFIDGDHSYEGVKQDFQAYTQFVARGGVVALHDIMYHPEYGVDRFWNEIKSQYASKEIIASRNQIGYGIGVLFF